MKTTVTARGQTVIPARYGEHIGSRRGHGWSGWTMGKQSEWSHFPKIPLLLPAEPQ
jgi:hypothetical protein